VIVKRHPRQFKNILDDLMAGRTARDSTRRIAPVGERIHAPTCRGVVAVRSYPHATHFIALRPAKENPQVTGIMQHGAFPRLAPASIFSERIDSFIWKHKITSAK